MRTTEQQIVALESRLQHATPTCDASTTDEILAEDWLNSNANGSLSTKAQSLAVIDKFRFLSIEDSDVRRNGRSSRQGGQFVNEPAIHNEATGRVRSGADRVEST